MAWIFDSFHPSAEGLGLYRIFCALFILLFALPPKSIYYFIGDLPSEFFSPPPGPMMLFEGFPPEAFLLTVHYMLIVALISLCIGLFTKTASIGAGILLLILQGFIFSLGKIDHDLLLLVVPLVMAFSGWGAAYSMDALRKRRGNAGTTTAAAYFPAPQAWTLTLVALITGFMFFTAGFPKVLGGWLNLSTQAVEGHYFKQFFVRGRRDLLAPYAQLIGSCWWEILDYATIFFEIGFLVAIFNSRSTRIFMCLAVLFHFGTMLILNISFVPNFVAYAAFLNWTWIDSKAIRLGPLSSAINRRRAPPLLVALGMILLFVVTWVWGMYNPSLLQSDWGTKGIVIVLTALAIAVFHLFKELREYLKR